MGQGTATTLADVHGLTINKAAVEAHVIQPLHVHGVVSSRGLEEGAPHAQFTFPSAPSYHFDVDGFGKALHAELKDSVAGYVMRLQQGGQTIYTLQWNWARRPGDVQEGWTPSVRMHIASCSKLITAIAMTKLLNDKKMSYDTPIIGYLPTYWHKGPNVNAITFRHLMTHRSGLNVPGSASDYQFMKTNIANGVTGIGTYHYQNQNFGLCRILISTINGNIAPGQTFQFPALPNANDQFWDYTTIHAYAAYVRDHVFAPAGVWGPTMDHPSSDALAYTFPTNGSGWNSGDLATMIGGAGWHMSVGDLLDVMDAFRRKGTIMSPAQAQAMLDNGFGIDVRATTPLGTLYNKNGRWASAGREEQSLAYFLPQNMEMVVLVNSPVGSPARFFRDVVTNLYNSHIKAG